VYEEHEQLSCIKIEEHHTLDQGYSDHSDADAAEDERQVNAVIELTIQSNIQDDQSQLECRSVGSHGEQEYDSEMSGSVYDVPAPLDDIICRPQIPDIGAPDEHHSQGSKHYLQVGEGTEKDAQLQSMVNQFMAETKDLEP